MSSTIFQTSKEINIAPSELMALSSNYPGSIACPSLSAEPAAPSLISQLQISIALHHDRIRSPFKPIIQHQHTAYQWYISVICQLTKIPPGLSGASLDPNHSCASPASVQTKIWIIGSVNFQHDVNLQHHYIIRLYHRLRSLCYSPTAENSKQ